MEEMAVQATALLMSHIRGQTDNDIQRTIPSTLVIRDSTGPCPAGGGK